MNREGTSKKGTPYLIRYPERGDVQSVWEYANRLSKEVTFIRFQGEDISFEMEERFVADKIKSVEEKTGVPLFLIVNGAVQGICDIDRKTKTESHIGELGLSVDASVRGEGLGKVLMQTVLDEARNIPELKKVVLSVLVPNDVAIALYKKLGFKEYGMLPQGARYRGELVDKLLMYKEM